MVILIIDINIYYNVNKSIILTHFNVFKKRYKRTYNIDRIVIISVVRDQDLEYDNML
jgi:hypothetical protein